MRGVHAGAQIYNCHKCDDSFELSGDLATHVRRNLSVASSANTQALEVEG